MDDNHAVHPCCGLQLIRGEVSLFWFAVSVSSVVNTHQGGEGRGRGEEFSFDSLTLLFIVIVCEYHFTPSWVKICAQCWSRLIVLQKKVDAGDVLNP